MLKRTTIKKHIIWLTTLLFMVSVFATTIHTHSNGGDPGDLLCITHRQRQQSGDFKRAFSDNHESPPCSATASTAA